jgi:hypothetical protein
MTWVASTGTFGINQQRLSFCDYKGTPLLLKLGMIVFELIKLLKQLTRHRRAHGIGMIRLAISIVEKGFARAKSAPVLVASSPPSVHADTHYRGMPTIHTGEHFFDRDRHGTLASHFSLSHTSLYSLRLYAYIFLFC